MLRSGITPSHRTYGSVRVPKQHTITALRTRVSVVPLLRLVSSGATPYGCPRPCFLASPLNVSPPLTHTRKEAGHNATEAAHEELMPGSSLWPSNLVIRGMTYLHDNAGLSWFGSIVVFTLALRILSLPLTLKAAKDATKMQKARQIMDVLVRERRMVDASTSSGRARLIMLNSQMRDTLSRLGVRPWSSLTGPFLSAPVFVSVYMGLNRITQMVPSLKAESFLWIPSLGARDPTFLTPFLSACTMALSTSSTPPSLLMKMALWIFPFITLPFVSKFPSAIILYFITTNGITLAQNQLLNNEKFRAFTKMPPRDIALERDPFTSLTSSMSRLLRKLRPSRPPPKPQPTPPSRVLADFDPSDDPFSVVPPPLFSSSSKKRKPSKGRKRR